MIEHEVQAAHFIVVGTSVITASKLALLPGSRFWKSISGPHTSWNAGRQSMGLVVSGMPPLPPDPAEPPEPPLPPLPDVPAELVPAEPDTPAPAVPVAPPALVEPAAPALPELPC